MEVCEVCGKEIKKAKQAIIEGSLLNVCDACAAFGKVIPEEKIMPQKKKVREEKEEEEIEIVENFPEIFRKLREKLGLTQDEFAKKVNEKESEIRKIEAGKILPSLELASKIEKQYGVKLIEKKEVELHKKEEEKKLDLTLGDVIKLKKKKS
jgi:putative transcription factor